MAYGGKRKNSGRKKVKGKKLVCRTICLPPMIWRELKNKYGAYSKGAREIILKEILDGLYHTK